MNTDQESMDAQEQLRRAYPAPSPDEIDGAWAFVAGAWRPRRWFTNAVARVAVAAALVAASFLAGYAAGRSGSRRSSNDARAAQLASTDRDLQITVRPPELVPASAVGGTP